MSDGLQSSLIGAAVAIAGSLFLYFGVRFTARQSTKAKKEEVEAGAYTRAQGIWEAATTRQDKELARLAAALDEQEKRHRQQIADLREERREHDLALNSRIDELEERDESSKRRIQALEARDDASQRRIEALSTYIRTLIAAMRDHKLVPPAAPPGMTFDDWQETP